VEKICRTGGQRGECFGALSGLLSCEAEILKLMTVEKERS